MIRRAAGYYELLLHVVPRLDLAHLSITRNVARLRNPAVEIWHGAVPDLSDNVERYVINHWRHHYAMELDRFGQVDGRLAENVKGAFPDILTQLHEYLEALPRVIAAFDALLARYSDTRQVTGAHRAALANAIEAELQP